MLKLFCKWFASAPLEQLLLKNSADFATVSKKQRVEEEPTANAVLQEFSFSTILT